MKRQCRIKFRTESNLTKVAVSANKTYSTAGVIAGARATGTGQHSAIGTELVITDFNRTGFSASVARRICGSG
jgi:hypothetical protein